MYKIDDELIEQGAEELLKKALNSVESELMNRETGELSQYHNPAVFDWERAKNDYKNITGKDIPKKYQLKLEHLCKNGSKLLKKLEGEK